MLRLGSRLGFVARLAAGPFAFALALAFAFALSASAAGAERTAWVVDYGAAGALVLVDAAGALSLVKLDGAAGGGDDRPPPPLFTAVPATARRTPPRARGPTPPPLSQRLRRLDARVVVLDGRVVLGAVDAAGALAAMKGSVRADAPATVAGRALALLDAHERWRAQVWPTLLALPGPRETTFASASAAWAAILEAALGATRRCGLVEDTMDHLPALVTALARSTGRPATPEAVRALVVRALAPGVLACLTGHRLEAARRAADRLAGPLAPFMLPGAAPGATKEAGSAAEATSAAATAPLARLLGDLVSALEGRPARAGSTDPRRAAALFTQTTRLEAREDVAAWRDALRRIGYPLP